MAPFGNVTCWIGFSPEPAETRTVLLERVPPFRLTDATSFRGLTTQKTVVAGSRLLSAEVIRWSREAGKGNEVTKCNFLMSDLERIRLDADQHAAPRW